MKISEKSKQSETMKASAEPTLNLLIASIEVFIENPDVSEIVIRRTQNTSGIQSANIYVNQKLVVFQEFQEGADTIAKDPDWKKNLLERGRAI